MIQFNLLPDVKLEYIRARYRKRMIMGLSVIASALFFSIFIVLFLFVRVSQTSHMKNLGEDIDEKLQEIQKTPDLNKILTIQNQLTSLPALHDKKVVSSRMIDFLTQLTPQQATISDLELNYTAGTMYIKGNSDSLITINKFVDTLKFTKYKTNTDPVAEGRAFKNVVLKGFTFEENIQDPAQRIIYELNFEFEPIIDTDNVTIAPHVLAVTYSNAKTKETKEILQVRLETPKIISTRSETEKPKELFVRPEVREDQ